MAGDAKERILETVLTFFAQSGYLGTSMSDIAGQLGITKGALHKHYASRREILDRIVERRNRITVLFIVLRQGGRITHERIYRVSKALGAMPGVWSENTTTTAAGNRIESISAVLPQMQIRKHY